MIGLRDIVAFLIGLGLFVLISLIGVEYPFKFFKKKDKPSSVGGYVPLDEMDEAFTTLSNAGIMLLDKRILVTSDQNWPMTSKERAAVTLLCRDWGFTFEARHAEAEPEPQPLNYMNDPIYDERAAGVVVRAMGHKDAHLKEHGFYWPWLDINDEATKQRTIALIQHLFSQRPFDKDSATMTQMEEAWATLHALEFKYGVKAFHAKVPRHKLQNVLFDNSRQMRKELGLPRVDVPGVLGNRTHARLEGWDHAAFERKALLVAS